MGGDAGRDIDKGHKAQRTFARPGDQHRHPFAGMIRAVPSGIIPVVGSKDRDVARAHPGQKGARPLVKGFQRPCITCHVPPVAIEAVELHKVRNR